MEAAARQFPQSPSLPVWRLGSSSVPPIFSAAEVISSRKTTREVPVIAVYVVVGVLVLLGIAFVLLYNRLIRLRNKVDTAWHQIDVELNRRHDLVPELTEVVKGYAGHESQTFESVASARSRAMAAEAPGEKAPVEDELSGALGNVIAVAESYPDLKANQDFLKLQKQLTETETRIAGSRKYYNGAVMYYDNARQGVPGRFVADMFKKSFGPRDYFEIKDPEDRLVPSAS